MATDVALSYCQTCSHPTCSLLLIPPAFFCPSLAPPLGCFLFSNPSVPFCGLPHSSRFSLSKLQTCSVLVCKNLPRQRAACSRSGSFVHISSVSEAGQGHEVRFGKRRSAPSGQVLVSTGINKYGRRIATSAKMSTRAMPAGIGMNVPARTTCPPHREQSPS